ncbi:hypothetical protein RND71_042381 [Anisodus tanguticus]|uniref:RRM domain-containing protein n=1 Tax=Anisodus tanguticus TaxID=243964 RepID=A0AAE1QRE1_9SOLA|nr:hypothetical protein RND71_042381 [Anisodus tanguticus]
MSTNTGTGELNLGVMTDDDTTATELVSDGIRWVYGPYESLMSHVIATAATCVYRDLEVTTFANCTSMDPNENGPTQVTPTHRGFENEVGVMDDRDEENNSRKRSSSSKTVPMFYSFQHSAHDYEDEKESSRSKDKEREKGKDKEKDRDRHHRDRSERRRTRDRDDDDADNYRHRSRDYDRLLTELLQDNHCTKIMTEIEMRGPDIGQNLMTGIERKGMDADLIQGEDLGIDQHHDLALALVHAPKASFKRISGFDMAPPASALLPVAPGVAGQLPSTGPVIPGILPNMFPLASGQLGALPFMPVQAMTQQAGNFLLEVDVVALFVVSSVSSIAGFFFSQATRHARRVYVGGLPPSANEQSVATYFNHVMSAISGNTAGPGDAVVNVYINYEKKFAFVEMRSVEEASNAMALDGIIFEGTMFKIRRPTGYNPSLAAALGPSEPNPNLNLAAVGLSPGSAGGLEGPDRIFGTAVKIRRPTDYNPSLAAALGPSEPNPNLNLAAVGLSPGSAGGLEGPDRIFVGGLPYYFTEAQIRELLESFGSLRGFNLVKDRDTGNSKGYAFCVYQDVSVTDIACAALNGIKMGDKTLTVRRASQGTLQPKPEQESVLMHVQQQIALQRLMLQPGGLPTKILCLTHVVSADELKDDEDYEDIMEDMRTECGKFGNLVNLVIPRPKPDDEPTPGVGKVFLEYADVESASRAQQGLNGRKFGGNQVIAVFYSENKFSEGDYES